VSRTAKIGGNVEAYTYNSVNKLTAYNSGDGTVAAYHYDALGRRVAKVVDGVETAYIYDPWNPYSSTANDILLEYQSGVLTRRWLHGTRVDEPLGFEAYAGTTAGGSGAANEVYTDRQGSVLAVVDPVTGTVEAAYEYDAFGKITQITGTLNQPFAYTGREYDPESGLYYYRARTYDPAIGQFLQPDPIGFAAGDLNIYAYVSNDPYNWSDPSGLNSAAAAATDAEEAAMASIAMGIIGSAMINLAQHIVAMMPGI
jgi:RHS repeat-associated protein